MHCNALNYWPAYCRNAGRKVELLENKARFAFLQSGSVDVKGTGKDLGMYHNSIVTFV